MKHLIQTPARAVLLSILLTSILGGVFPLAMTPAVAAERAVTVEKNPPGDIPDSQVFVKYQSPLGFSVQVPEGWSRTDHTSGVNFSDKFNKIDISVEPMTAPPSVASATRQQAAELIKRGRAVKMTSIKDVDLPTGPVIVMDYESNSEPNQITNKQLRLESNRYLFFRNGKLATLDLSAPKGADNVDQWRLISQSFRWN